jgi:hypothetical protein
MKRLLVFLLIISILVPLFSQSRDTTDTIREKIVAYKFFNDYTGLYIRTIDTSLHNFQVYNPVFKNLAINQYLGNLGQAYKSVLANEQVDYTDFLFDTYTRYNFHTPENVQYYKVLSPYTVISYYTGGPKSRQEQKLNIIHTQNVNKNLNLGFLGDLVYSDGEFQNQKTSGNYFTLFSSYEGQRYRYNCNVNLNTLKTNYNGGLLEDSVYENFPNIKANTIDVSLNSASSKQRNISFFLQHRFFLTGSYKKDSLQTTSRWSEFASFIHRVQFDMNWRSFSDNLETRGYGNSIERDFYSNVYIDSSKTYDSTYFRRLENSIFLALNTNTLLKVPAELRVGLKNQLDYWRFSVLGDSMSVERANSFKNHEINTALVGTLTNRFSKTITWGAMAEIYFTGFKAGNVYASGDLSKTIKNNFVMTLSGDFKLEKPQYFIQYFSSNHFNWGSSELNWFDAKSSNTILKARFAHEKFKIALEGISASYINFVYFNSLGLPDVVDKPFNVYMVSLKKHFDLRIFYSLFKVTLQRSGNEIALPLPNIVTYNSSYFAFNLVKNVLKIQFGFDLFYNTRYNAMSFMPPTSIFYSQQNQKVGNYPLADVFLNINLKRARVFVKYENVTSYTAIPKSYYIPHYPYSPSILKYGIS